MRQDLAELGVGAIAAAVARSPYPQPAVGNIIPSEVLDGEGLDFESLAISLASNQVLLFTAPELCLLEALAAIDFSGTTYVFQPNGLSAEHAQTLRKNVPRSLDVRVLGRIEPPDTLSPFGASLVTTGFDAGGGLTLIPAASLRVLQMWERLWFGRRTVVIPMRGRVRSRPPGWSTVDTNATFSHVLALPDVAERPASDLRNARPSDRADGATSSEAS